MESTMMHRRLWLGRLLSMTGLLAAVSMTGCAGGGASSPDGGKSGKGSAPDCSESGSVSDADRKAREALGYESSATDPERRCSGCALYVPPKGEGCAGCMLFKGPILPEGSCIQFQPRPS